MPLRLTYQREQAFLPAPRAHSAAVWIGVSIAMAAWAAVRRRMVAIVAQKIAHGGQSLAIASRLCTQGKERCLSPEGLD